MLWPTEVVYRAGPSPAGTCPRCRETLLAVEAVPGIFAREGLPGARWCEKCGGVFADTEASRRILVTLDRVLLEIGFQASLGKERKKSNEDDGRPLTCPECLIEMVKSRIESAACDIDACPMHGTWFDTGELVTVIRAFETARKRGVMLDRKPGPDAFVLASRRAEEERMLGEADDGVAATLIRWLMDE